MTNSAKMYEYAISVIVPVYDVETCLPDCIDSILNQTFKNIEVILISDGPQSCHDICDKFAAKDSRVTVVKDVKKGLGAARNLGLGLAQGEFVSFVDSDDWIAPDFLEKLYAKAKSTGAEVVYSDTIYVENGKEITDNYISRSAFKVKKDVVTGLEDKQTLINSVVVWNKLYKTMLLKERGIYFPENVVHEDLFYTTAAVFSAQKIALEKSAKYYYSIRQNSLMNSPNTAGAGRVDDMLTVFSRLVEFVTPMGDDYLDAVWAFIVNDLYIWGFKKIRNEHRHEFFVKVRKFLSGLDVQRFNGKTRRRCEKVMGISWRTKSKWLKWLKWLKPALGMAKPCAVQEKEIIAR